MYEQAAPPRRSPISTLIWAIAVVLSLAAVGGTVWVLTRDLSTPQAAPAQSTTQSTTDTANTPGPSPASPDSSPTPSTPSPSATPSTPPTPPVVAVQGAASGRCLDVPGGAAVDGTPLAIYDCTGSAGQQWTASASGELRTLGSMCLDDANGGQPEGPATISACHGGTSQQWSPQPDGTVRNVATGLCLDVSAALTDNGSPVITYGCHGGDNQRWSTS